MQRVAYLAGLDTWAMPPAGKFGVPPDAGKAFQFGPQPNVGAAAKHVVIARLNVM
jgi:hypothetical protein